MDTRQRDNEKLRVIKKHLKAKCEARGTLVTYIEVIISFSGRADRTDSKYKHEQLKAQSSRVKYMLRPGRSVMRIWIIMNSETLNMDIGEAALEELGF